MDTLKTFAKLTGALTISMIVTALAILFYLEASIPDLEPNGDNLVQRVLKN